MNRLRVGIYGVRRALNIMRRGLAGNLAQIVAVTDPDAELVRNASDEISSLGAAAYTEFGRFLGVGLDAVIIAGPPGRQASPAIKALRHGIDVLCYPMPVSMLDEAFLLERTVREGGRIFAFAEPYCYRRGVMTAREMYRNGDIGKLLSVEATRVGREPLTTKVPKGEAYLPSTFMCSASVGPMFFATGLRPLRVIGMETPRAGFTSSKGAKHASAATELFEFDGGAVGRSFHGELSCPPRFTLTMCGETGTIEVCGDRLLHHDYSSGRRVSSDLRRSAPRFPGANYYADDLENAEASAICCFIGKLLGDVDSAACSIDVWRALDISLSGLLAYRSVLDGGRAFMMPDTRTDDGREFCRGDRFTTDPDADAKYRLPPNKNRGAGKQETLI